MYTEPVDVWSLGGVVGEMLMCEELFGAASEQDVVRVMRIQLGMDSFVRITSGFDLRL
jgi:hypothetical protein